MASPNKKRVISLRLPVDLIERLKSLARREHRSLNNYVETALYDLAYSKPNETTIQSFEDAKAGRTYGPIDTSSVDNMLESIDT